MCEIFHPPTDSDRAVDCSVSMARANVLMFAFATPLVSLLAVTFAAFWGWAALWAGLDRFLTLYIFVPVVLAGIIVHELIHATSWAVLSKRPLSSVQIGFKRQTLTPFAHVKAPIPVIAYRLGTLMPCLLLGVIPSAIAVAWGQGPLMAFGLFFSFVAGGDLIVLWLVRKVPAGKLVQDHPERAGCLVVEPAAVPPETR